MIGVFADSKDEEIVREFFELFKTPWEIYQRDRWYEVLLCAGDTPPDASAQLVLVYAGRQTQFDDRYGIETGCQRTQCRILSFQDHRIPIYGASTSFPECGNGLLIDADSQQYVTYLDRSGQRRFARIGYDLFDEIRTLLEKGQPPVYAGMPALELHIAVLRELVIGCGVRLTEIPPVPDGYRFIACLTHDVDHPSIRQHTWDHTLFGFLYRAIFTSSLNCMRGRMPVRRLLMNWMAVLKLPFVYLGLAKDFWRDFDDRYLALEHGLPSTFFVIPFDNRPGVHADRKVSFIRAARYAARDLADTLQKLLDAGCEVALHGIDAWLDEARGREELEEIRSLTKSEKIGVRMHWLYYAQPSPTVLERAGALYDSTIGYNETVGYHAGTTQVYKPVGVTRLLELPLHVMDTALFYPGHLGLSSPQATALLNRMVDTAVQFGGCFTINWHDRSTAPERLWGDCYRDLLAKLKREGAWFATAGDAVAWFRKRRSVAFETDLRGLITVRADSATDGDTHTPDVRLRTFRPQESDDRGFYDTHYSDAALTDASKTPPLRAEAC